ncbi:MAG: cation:dicarboxylate symporter family transporter [Cetobacterium sp.]
MMGIDRLLDMLRTVVNVTGDAICTLIVAKTESEIIEVEEDSFGSVEAESL